MTSPKEQIIELLHREDLWFDAGHGPEFSVHSGADVVLNLLAAAFDHGWREGKGIPTPADFRTGKILPIAGGPTFNPYRSQT